MPRLLRALEAGEVKTPPLPRKPALASRARALVHLLTLGLRSPVWVRRPGSG
jgi:hypothetical protein